MRNIFGSSKNRLLSIFWASEVALITIFIQRYLLEVGGHNDLIVLITAVLLIPSYYYAKQNKLEKGIAHTLFILTVTLCYLMWVSEGVRDEVVFGFPAIICFAAMMEKRKLLFLLFSIIFINLLLIGVGNELGYFSHNVNGNSLNSALLVLTIFSVITYAVTSVIDDLSSAKIELEEHRNSLEEKVTERTAELERSILLLTEAQEQLIEAEKMASLGRMVAGVAHEINTPVGIGVTATTHGIEKIEKFEKELNNNNITKSGLENFVEELNQSLTLTYSNLKRAGDLISNFKQAAVEQSNENITTFKLNQLIERLVDSLSPKLTDLKIKIKINYDFDSEQSITSSEGALSQVITNLFINSLIHGFENMDDGEITISTEIISNQVKIGFQDTGIGMNEDTLTQIFEPFYTTKRGQGGSGLGMHIVYNLVTKSLKGHIHCESQVNIGTTFNITIPTNVKLAEHSD